jgi:photosystem II stability/assembly factor-like uncharacterized protein
MLMLSGLLRMFLCLGVLLASFATAPLAADWTRIGPDGGPVDAVAAAPSRPSTLYARLSGNLLFRSTDGGRTWIRISDNLLGFTSFFDLVVDPLVPARVFALTGEGLFLSNDGGATWFQRNPGGLDPLFDISAVALAVHPRRPATLLASFNHPGALGGLYRSTDRGLSWTRNDSWPDELRFIESVPAEPDTFWAASGSRRLWRTRDAGQTWTEVSRGIPPRGRIQALAVDPRAPRTAYASVFLAQGDGAGIYKTVNGGDSWRLIRAALPLKLIVDAQGVVYAVFEDEHLERSLNGGTTWTRAGTPRSRIVDLEPTPSGLLAGTEAGVFRSTDRAATWQSLNRGLSELSIDGLAIDGQNPPRLYASDPLAGVYKTTNRGESWLHLGHPEPRNPIRWGLPLAVSPADPQVVYAGVTGAVAKSTNGGRRWDVRGVLTCMVTGRLLIDPREPSTLYASGGFFTSECGFEPDACTLWRSLDAGESWECAREGLPGTSGGALGIDPFTSALYAVAAPQDLWRSTDRGNTWTLVYPGLKPSSALIASTQTAGTYYVGRQGEVGRSRDSGQTWQFFSTGLPAQSFVHILALDPTNDSVLYAGLDEGVFKSTDAGETWTPVGTWPAGVWPTGLVIDAREPSILYAGTNGEGVLRYEP